MARIESKPEKDYPFLIRWLFKKQKQKYGQTLEPAKLWARSPWLFLGVATLFGALDRKSSPIDPALRALITVRVSQINWCRFCVDINSATVLQRGAEMEKLNDLARFRESPHYDDREKLALEYAEAMTLGNQPPSGEMVARLKEMYSEDEIVEMTGLIAFQNLSSRFNAALDVEPQGFCQSPPQPGE
ncbi:MAG: carboxymuconolactone decarboxylase family protein [bacterium]|nr:carboxymuconolactone decarboxylase family protein [bacterium]